MAAFAAAIAHGIDGIETDVRLTADGHLVLHHDRAIPDGRLVSSVTRAEFNRVLQFDVPTLQEALRQFPNVMWNVEIKTRDAVRPTLAALRRYPSSGHLLVTSFIHSIIAEIVEEMDINCGVLIAHRPLDGLDLAGWFPAKMKVKRVVWDYEACDRDLVAGLSQRGIKNLVYGPATRDELLEVSKWPIEGVITDRPDLLAGR